MKKKQQHNNHYNNDPIFKFLPIQTAAFFGCVFYSVFWRTFFL